MLYLYRFSFYSSPQPAATLLQEWMYTSYEQAIEHDAYPGVVFQPLAGLTHSEVRLDSERSAGQLRVTVPRDNAVASMFLGGYPSGSIYLRVIELEEPGDEFPTVIWRGRVRACEFNELTAEMTCTNGREALERLGLRINGGPACQWALYSERCGVDPAPYTRTGTVTSISADGLTIETTLNEATDYFRAGPVEARGQVRMCTKSEGGTLTVLSAFSGLQVGDAITAKRGCDRSASATSGCKSFSNYSRYSGFEGFPVPKNVFVEGV